METNLQNYMSVKLAGILNSKKLEISKDIQNAGKIKAETSLNVEVKSEISETDNYNPETGSNEKILGQKVENFEFVEVYVKKEISEEPLIRNELKDPNLFENEINKNLESHNIKNEENEDGLIPFELVEFYGKKEINEELIIKDDKEGSDLFVNENNKNLESHNIKNEKTVENIPSNCSIESDAQSSQSDSHSSDGRQKIDADKRYKCDVCQKTFKRLFYMKRHKLMHTGELPFSCKICQKSFRDSFTMINHERMHTGERPFPCKFCPKSFTALYTLKRHERIHTGKKLVRCEICHNSIDSAYFKRHKLTHSSHIRQKSFVCRICGIGFTTSTQRKRHNLIHTGEKPHRCEVCHKSFRQLAHLKTHNLIHTGEKPFTCEICNKSFRDPSGFRNHKRTHSDK